MGGGEGDGLLRFDALGAGRDALFTAFFVFCLTGAALELAPLPFGSDLWWPFVFAAAACLSLSAFCLGTVPRAGRLTTGDGCDSVKRVLTRPDLRFPSSIRVVGPSASNFFHGGEIGFGFRWIVGGGVASRTRRRFTGRSSISEVASSSAAGAACSEEASSNGFSSNSSDWTGVNSESLLSLSLLAPAGFGWTVSMRRLPCLGAAASPFQCWADDVVSSGAGAVGGASPDARSVIVVAQGL